MTRYVVLARRSPCRAGNEEVQITTVSQKRKEHCRFTFAGPEDLGPCGDDTRVLAWPEWAVPRDLPG